MLCSLQDAPGCACSGRSFSSVCSHGGHFRRLRTLPRCIKKKRGRELQLLILYVLRIYIHKFLEIMGVLLNMFYLDEYISFFERLYAGPFVDHWNTSFVWGLLVRTWPRC